jgi:ADP-ribose pyrophosphatase YjhB (NUDIX family)
MLPSSHLMIHESPQEAARRILREQLGLDGSEVAVVVSLREEPRVVSEVYSSKATSAPGHWDIEFIFQGSAMPGILSELNKVHTGDDLNKGRPWTELAFVDLRRTPKSGIARSHEDILESCGFALAAT